MHRLINCLRSGPVVRDWDEHKMLTSAGFRWNEPQMWVFQMFGTGAFVLVPYAMLCLGDPRTPEEFTRKVVLGAAACVAACILMGSIRRGISFERDGRIRNRGGWMSWLDLIGCQIGHADIASIEVTKTEEGFGVAIYTTEGGTEILSENLSEAQARLAAVQLTIALREMRASLSTVHAAAHHPQGATRQPAWID